MVILLASGVGLVTAALTVRYRDVNYFVPFMLQFLLFASPIAYSIQRAVQVPGHLRHQPADLAAPGVPVVVRATPPRPHLWEIGPAIVVPIVVFVGGAIIFEQMERGFADSI